MLWRGWPGRQFRWRHPVPGKQVIDSIGWAIAELDDDVADVLVGIHAVELAGRNDRLEDGEVLRMLSTSGLAR